MSEQLNRLKVKLRELFQLDQPDLDFGFYRIMHAKSAEVTRFLDQELLPQVRSAFGEYRSADKVTLQREFDEAVAQARSLGADPDTLPKVKALRLRLDNDAVDVAGLETEVYDHLFSFFRRYYSEGDFLSRRVYKPGVYAIPYEGEEVKLHWANADQYYIKTSEYLRDYAFRLKPDDLADPMRVRFRLVDAAEGEHGNVKEAEGRARVFVLQAADFMAEVDGEQGRELEMRFEYRPATLSDWPEAERADKTKPPGPKDLLALAERRILATETPALRRWLDALARPHMKADGETAEYSRLRAHMNRYTKRNTCDYFIHKDLGGFLRRELDFYIKNEVMHLDDIEEETVPRVEQYLSKIKVIRKIAGKVIDFLAQLENFQKKLWLKKKVVVETSWLIRVGCIPEEFYPEIAANDTQRKEWANLLAIDELTGNLTTPGYSVPLTVEFLKAHPTLVVDSAHLSSSLASRLLGSVSDVDSTTDGVLAHSENSQAIRLMATRLSRSVASVVTDPPYNTDNREFSYKDSYRHSSWMTMMVERLALLPSVAAPGAVLFASIDDNELEGLLAAVREVIGEHRHRVNIVWQKKDTPANDALGLSVTHDYVVVVPFDEEFRRGLIPRTDLQRSNYRNPDNDPRGEWTRTALMIKRFVPGNDYPVTSPTGRPIAPPPGLGWSMSPDRFQALVEDGRVWWGKDEQGVPFEKTFLAEAQDGVVPVSWWDYRFAGSNRNAKAELRELFVGEPPFDTPKPTRLIERILQVGGGQTILDLFAGSGTVGHAVVSRNRDDGISRRFVLVEQADYFRTVLVPRLKKVTFTPEWKDGKPKRLATAEEAERSPRIMKVIRLESYEDALNNLDLRRTSAQQSLLDAPAAQGADGLREDYLLRYMLDVETQGSQSLLNVAAFTDPRAYRLKVKRPGSDESLDVNVDLLETFNWLVGLTVRHIAAPHTFSASFVRDEDPDLPAGAVQRLLVDGRLREDPNGPWWFRTVTGTTPDGRRTLIVWRTRPGGETLDGVEQDNVVLDEWFQRQRMSPRDQEFDLIYVNGGNNLENLKTPDDTWKVRLIEEDFHRLMFDMEGV